MDSKTIVITGANRGIGEQLALRYAVPGNHLILIARQQTPLKRVAAACETRGAKVTQAVLDIREAEQVAEFLLRLDAQSPIDLIIANAGVAATLQPNWTAETSLGLQHNFSINLQGTLNTITPLITRMIARQQGQIALMGSIAGLRGLPQSPSYSASKAAVHIYGQALRAWLSRYHVKVNVIIPGYVKTEMSDRLTGPKPLRMSSAKVAKIIQRGLDKNKAYIAFPKSLYWLTRITNLLPSGLVDRILNQVESYAQESSS